VAIDDTAKQERPQDNSTPILSANAASCELDEEVKTHFLKPI
jgi:hypothetical protein